MSQVNDYNESVMESPGVYAGENSIPLLLNLGITYNDEEGESTDDPMFLKVSRKREQLSEPDINMKWSNRALLLSYVNGSSNEQELLRSLHKVMPWIINETAQWEDSTDLWKSGRNKGLPKGKVMIKGSEFYTIIEKGQDDRMVARQGKKNKKTGEKVVKLLTDGTVNPMFTAVGEFNRKGLPSSSLEKFWLLGSSASKRKIEEEGYYYMPTFRGNDVNVVGKADALVAWVALYQYVPSSDINEGLATPDSILDEIVRESYNSNSEEYIRVFNQISIRNKLRKVSDRKEKVNPVDQDIVKFLGFFSRYKYDTNRFSDLSKKRLPRSSRGEGGLTSADIEGFLWEVSSQANIDKGEDRKIYKLLNNKTTGAKKSLNLRDVFTFPEFTAQTETHGDFIVPDGVVAVKVENIGKSMKALSGFVDDQTLAALTRFANEQAKLGAEQEEQTLPTSTGLGVPPSGLPRRVNVRQTTPPSELPPPSGLPRSRLQLGTPTPLGRPEDR